MNESLKATGKLRLENVAEELRKKHMDAYVLNSKSEVPQLVKELLKDARIVANGGSMTLAECGVINLLQSGDYEYLDTSAPNADRPALYRQAFLADAYLASANAITNDGHIYEMDGNSNRIAALCFGPESVIIVAGINKIVPDIACARLRNKNICAPANAHRLSCKTPCAKTGKCTDCSSPERICCNELVMGPQRMKGRIKVILVNEAVGY